MKTIRWNHERPRRCRKGWLLFGLLAATTALAQETWTPQANLPTSRASLATAVLDGKIYVLGGNRGTRSTEYTAAVEVYDPRTEAWTAKAPLSAARTGLAASVVNGQLYAIGGGDVGTLVEVYDPGTNTWIRRADLPVANDLFATSTIAGKIFAIGGQGGGSDRVFMYDPASDTWTRRADMPTPRCCLWAETVGGTIYAIGGENPATNGGRFTVEAYDPLTDTWTSKAHMVQSRYGAASVVVDGQIYVFGGGTGSGRTVYSSGEIYDPDTDTWTSGPSLTSGRQGLGAEVIQGRLYVMGGRDCFSCRGWDLMESLTLELSAADRPSPRSILLQPTESIRTLAGGPPVSVPIEVQLEGLAADSEPALHLDLTPLGQAESMALAPQGAGRYTGQLQLTPPTVNGVFWLPVGLAETPGATQRLATFLHLAVFPARTYPLFGDDEAPQWEAISRVLLEPQATDQVFEGTTSLGVQPQNTRLPFRFGWVPSEPVPGFGYRLHVAFHPGEAEPSSNFSLTIQSQEDLRVVDLVGSPDGSPLVDLAHKAWQVVELPLDPGPIDGLTFQGVLNSTFYLDDIRLVPVEVPTTPSTAVMESYQSPTPDDFNLDQNYPNPFNSGTVIRFALPQSQAVALAVYNLAGQQVATLVEGVRATGTYAVQWNGRDDQERDLASGLYFYRLQAGDRIETRKLLLLR